MQKSYDHVKAVGEEKGHHLEVEIPEEVKQPYPQLETGVSAEELKQINEELLAWPENFRASKQIGKNSKKTC